MKSARSTVVSLRLPGDSARRLSGLARRHGWSASEAGARLIEEGLRRQEFAWIDFRDSVVGRQAYLQASTLAVWEVVWLLRQYKGSVPKVAAHLEWPEAKVRAAGLYADAYPEEIAIALDENTPSLVSLQRLLPQLEVLTARRRPSAPKRRNAQAAAR